METYTREQIAEIEKLLNDAWNDGLGSFHDEKTRSGYKAEQKEFILDAISNLPVSSEKEKEPDGWIVGGQFYESAFVDDQRIKDLQLIPVYFSPVPSNRIGVEELREIFIFLERVARYINSDESPYSLSNSAKKILDKYSLSVSDEVKKPIEEVPLSKEVSEIDLQNLLLDFAENREKEKLNNSVNSKIVYEESTKKIRDLFSSSQLKK